MTDSTLTLPNLLVLVLVLVSLLCSLPTVRPLHTSSLPIRHHVLPSTRLRATTDSQSTLPRVVWKATARSYVAVKELKRSCEEYMALPPTEYSVLAQDQIVRLSDDEFKCMLPSLNFFGYKLRPIVYATVTVFPEEARSVINVTKAEIEGDSPLLQKINSAFTISAVNTVFASKDQEGFKYLNSNTTLTIDTAIPSRVIPLAVVRTGGNVIIQTSLKIAVITFVRILAADFKRWSAGNNERSAVEGAKLELE